MLGNINTNDTRANWTTVPGRSVALEVNANGQYTKETYKDENGDTVFAVNYTYNAAGKVILITCTQN